MKRFGIMVVFLGLSFPCFEQERDIFTLVQGGQVEKVREALKADPKPVNATGRAGLKGPYSRQKPPGLKAEVFAPGVVSKDGIQMKLTMSADGSQILYTERDPATNVASFIVRRRAGDSWGEPLVLPYSREYVDIEPSLSPRRKEDPLRLQQARKRPRRAGKNARHLDGGENRGPLGKPSPFGSSGLHKRSRRHRSPSGFRPGRRNLFHAPER